MDIGIIIQARTSSTRLPKKVIKKIEGKTVLEHVIERVKRAANCNKIILATTDKKEDDVLAKIGAKLNIDVFRGSENDVLERFYLAAKFFDIDPIVRITADCPLIDPKIIEKVIDLYLKGGYDYVSNSHPPTFPDGMDAEIFSFKALKRSWKQAKMKSEREHVIPYMIKNKKIFKLGNVVSEQNLNHIRLTLDEKEDLTLIRKVYKELYGKNHFFGLKEVLKLFDKNPELMKINQDIGRNEGYAGSLKQDKIYE